MMISSMGSNNYPIGQMAGMRSRPSPAEMFNKIDEDGSGGLDQTEFSDLAAKVGEMTGKDVDAEDLFAQYDADGDGQLSEEETQTFMDDNRPEGPPPGGMMGGMGAVQGPPPDLSQVFSDADEDEDGSLDADEAEGIAEMISNATDEEISADELIAAYDEDGDGTLSEDETLAALEANRPEGASPPPEEDDGALASRSWSQVGGIDNYLMMANLGREQNQSSAISKMLSSGSLDSSSALFSLNTMA